MFPEYNIYSSAIVGGVLPISVGVALSIKRRGADQRVHCFVGDMTAESGIAHECFKYSKNHELPIRFIIEDNNKSVMTDTRLTWNMKKTSFEDSKIKCSIIINTRKISHAGAGHRVQF